MKRSPRRYHYKLEHLVKKKTGDKWEPCTEMHHNTIVSTYEHRLRRLTLEKVERMVWA